MAHLFDKCSNNFECSKHHDNVIIYIYLKHKYEVPPLKELRVIRHILNAENLAGFRGKMILIDSSIKENLRIWNAENAWPVPIDEYRKFEVVKLERKRDESWNGYYNLEQLFLLKYYLNDFRK